jgi:hypothetical protein
MNSIKLVFIILFVTFGSVSGVDIKTISDLVNTVSNEVSTSSASSDSIVSAAASTAAASTVVDNAAHFSGTGHIVGGVSVPHTEEAIRQARNRYYEQNAQQSGSVLAQGAQELVNIASNNVQQTQSVVDSTLGVCLRSG